jgi:hypothetical protein
MLDFLVVIFFSIGVATTCIIIGAIIGNFLGKVLSR